MAQQRGSTTKILIAKESSFKVAATGGMTHLVPFVTEGVRYNRNLLSSKTIRTGRQAQQPVTGAVDVTGDISFELAPSHGKLLHQVFGSYTAQTGTGGAYTHTFKVGDLPSFTMEKQFPDLATPQYFKYVGCKVNSFKFSAKAEGFIDCSVTVMGAKEVVGASSFDNSPTDPGFSPWSGFNCSIHEGTTLSPIGTATQIDFTIENNLDGNQYVIDGTGERYSLPEGVVKVSGTLTALFDSVTLYNKAVNSTESSIQIILSQGDGTGQAVGKEKITFTFPEVLFKPQAPVISGPSGLVVELPFECYYNNDTTYAITAQAVLSSPVTWYD